MPGDFTIAEESRFILEAQAPRSSVLNYILLYGACALLMFSVLAFGAVEAWAICVLQCGAVLLFLFWAGMQLAAGKLRVAASPLYAPMLLFAGVVMAQLVFAASAYRHATLSYALLYTAYGLLLFVVMQAVNADDCWTTLPWVLTVFGFALAVFAIAQDLAPNEKLYWIRKPQFGGFIFGPYVNHNHYAGVMEMLFPIPLVLALGRLSGGGKRALLAFAAVVMAGSIVLSQSRGGCVAVVVQLVLLAALLGRRQSSRRAAVGVAAFCLLLALFLLWTANAGTFERFRDPSPGLRPEIARDALRMFSQKPVLGWGLGVFPTVYPRFRSYYTDLFVNHAHNDYLQLLVETGVAGFLLMVWWVAVVLRRGLANVERWRWDWRASMALSSLIACSGILVHSFFEFNLHIPANAAFFYFFCALATTRHESSSHAPRPRRGRREETVVSV